MRRPVLGLLACVLASTIFPAAPASAETGHKSKEVGNAPASIDITGVEANNAQRRVKVELVVPGLSDRGTFTFTYESDRYDGMAITVRKRGNRVARQVWHCTEETCDKVRCPRTKIRWNVAGHYIGASVPQSCYPLKVPGAWNFNGHSDLGDAYDSDYLKLRLRRG